MRTVYSWIPAFVRSLTATSGHVRLRLAISTSGDPTHRIHVRVLRHLGSSRVLTCTGNGRMKLLTPARGIIDLHIHAAGHKDLTLRWDLRFLSDEERIALVCIPVRLAIRLVPLTATAFPIDRTFVVTGPPLPAGHLLLSFPLSGGTTDRDHIPLLSMPTVPAYGPQLFSSGICTTTRVPCGRSS